jgi:poly-beta-1,6-N-acetyl-D-glucosamine N-deacetylase
MIDGVLFQDDGYLSDYEDFSASALESYEKITGNRGARYDALPDDQKRRWTELKTDKLLELTDRLEASVRRWRPTAAFARCLYARTILEPESEEWYAQDFRKSLERYDYVAVMAYPDMEGASDAEAWLRNLVAKAASFPRGLEKTVFKTQAYDWSRKRRIDPGVLGKRIAVLRAAGAVNVGYYPDDYTVDAPELGAARDALSPPLARRAEASR